MLTCECITWCRVNNKLGTDHHDKCPKYLAEVEQKAKTLLTKILNHFRDYCNEGDGIPEEAWEDYKKAVFFVGDMERWSKLEKMEPR